MRITNCQRKIVLEDGYGICKVDSMFGEICRGFAPIPLEAHASLYAHLYTDVKTQTDRID